MFVVLEKMLINIVCIGTGPIVTATGHGPGVRMVRRRHVVLCFGTSGHDASVGCMMMATLAEWRDVQFLGPPANITVGIATTIVAVGIARGGIRPVGVTAETQAEP